MLALKLTLVPLMLAALSLAGRHWGPGVAGWLAGMPVVGGPILFFLALERGPQFAAQAATASLAAVAGSIGFNIAYCWGCRRHGWAPSMAAGVGAWFAVFLFLSLLPMTLWSAGTFVIAALLIAPRLFPPIEAPSATRELPKSEIAVRMIAGVVVTLAVTGAAEAIGPKWSGLFAVFPTLSLVLAVFLHRANGPQHSAAFLRAMVPGLYSLAGFCFVVATVLPQYGIAIAFSLAVGVALGVQVFWQIAPGLRRAIA